MTIGFKGYEPVNDILFSKALSLISYESIYIKDNFNVIFYDLLSHINCPTLQCDVLFINLDIDDNFYAIRLVKYLKIKKSNIIIIATASACVDKEIEIALFNANINDVLTGDLDPELILVRLENQLKHIHQKLSQGDIAIYGGEE